MNPKSVWVTSVSGWCCLVNLALFSLCGVQAATNDVTGATPTLAVTFDNSSVVNDNGTGTIGVNNEGTPTYVTSPNGKAINTAIFTPYGNLGNVFFAGNNFTVSAYATLGINPNGIMFHLRDDVGGAPGGLVMRRGSTNEVMVTLGVSTTPVITVSNIPGGDTVYHHYAVAATPSLLTLYVDGVARGSVPSNAIASLKYAYQFGSRHGGVRAGESKFGGRIDDLRVYSADLSQSQIQTLATSLIVSGANAGMISVKTGVRDDTVAGGNVWLFPTTLGPVATASGAWNKTLNWNGNNSGTTGVITNLMNSAESLTLAKLYFTFPNTYLGGGATDTANGSLTKTYFDDGTAASYSVTEGASTVVLPDPGVTRGWEVMLTGVPYQHADLYVIIGSDVALGSLKACPIMIKVGGGSWTYYYGSPGLEKTLVGNVVWPGASYSTGTLKEGSHYLKIQLSNLASDTPIAIAHGARNTGNTQRIGLAGLQLVKRDSAIGVTDDPYYLRTVTGTTNWNAALWDNAGTSNNSWSNSTAAWKTTALLTSSGTTTLTLPEESITAEAVSVKGSGAFTLSGPGVLALNGASMLDTYAMGAGDVIDIAASVVGSNVTLAANNYNANGVGYTKLSNSTNAFTSLSVTRGALAANSQLPAVSSLVLKGGNLMYTTSGTITNPLQLAVDSKLRVWSSLTGEVSGPLSGTGNLTKSDAGALILSGGGTFKNLSWDNSGLVRLAGTAPFLYADTAGYNNSAATLEFAAPVTMSGALYLGGTTMTLGADAVVKANALRWCDGGTFNTTANQTGGQLVILGSNNSVSTGASVIFAHWSSVCNYALSGGDFLATNAVALVAWDGSTTWTISGSGRAYVKGVNMRGSGKVGMASTLLLNGGTLEVGDSGIFTSGVQSTRTIELSTGLVRAVNDFTVAANAVSTAVALKNSATGVTLDTNGKTVTWNAPLSDVGKLVVADSAGSPGRLRLMGSSNHSGGTELRAGTLETGHASALGTGSLDVSGGTLDLVAVDATAGAMTVTNTMILKARVSMVADFSGSGSLTPSSLTINNPAANTIQVVLDLNNIDTPLAEYPLILTSSYPADATNKMTATFINGGAGLLPTASVSLQSRTNGIYAVFSGVVPPRNLFWRNGVASGVWVTEQGSTPWGVDSVSGAASDFKRYDTVNFTGIDQTSATVSIQGQISPVAMNLNNTGTDYTFSDAGSGSLVLPALSFSKLGDGRAIFNLPVILTNALAVEAGSVAWNSSLGTGTVEVATFAAPFTVASNTVVAFGSAGQQTLSGLLSGGGRVSVTAGRLRLASSAAGLSGDVIATGGVLELPTALGFLNSAANLRVEAGATMEFTGLDASGYNVTNTKPIEIAGTLKVLQRDSTARGVKLYDGAAILLKGSNMDSGHALDLYNQPIFALVSGAASIRPLDPNDAAQASITVRTEHTPKTFDVQAPTAVLTIESPFINGAPGITLDKVGPGRLLLTGVSTTTSKLKVSAGTLEIGGGGLMGAGSSAQPIEVLEGATFRYASSSNQLFTGTITCAGTFEKTGSGYLAVTGSLAVSTGGSLVVPAGVSTSDVVRVDNLTLGGELRVGNFGSLTPGKTYALLTAASALPAGIESQVTGLNGHWTAELIDSGKTLIIYKKFGTMVIVH